MNVSALVVTSIGNISSFIVFILNIFLIYKTRHRKKEIVLFYFRFYIDAVFGLTYFLYSFFVLEFSYYGKSFFFYHSDLFWLGLPFSNASAARSFLILLIVFDRILATYLPIRYHNIRPSVPNLPILVLPFLFTCVEDFMIFIVCGMHIDVIPETCVAFPCTLTPCGYSWWTSYKSVMFPVIIFLTFLLCIKLMVFSKKLHPSGVSRRANRLALLDAFLITFFDFIPAFCAYQFPSSILVEYTSTGPVTAMLKQLGRALEGLIVIEILVRRNPKAEEIGQEKRKSIKMFQRISGTSKPSNT